MKIGDIVIRDMCGIKEEIEVTAVSEKCIQCGPWDFHPVTLFEIDEDLGWDGITKSGSKISLR